MRVRTYAVIRWVIFCAAAFWVAASSSLPAEAPTRVTGPAEERLPAGNRAGGAMKIGFVDVDKITEKSEFVRALLGELEKDIRSKSDALQRQKAEYTRMQEEIERKRPVLKDEQIEEMIQSVRKMRVGIDDAEYELNRLLREAERDRMGPALNRILRTIEQLGKGEGYDLILRGEVVLYGAPQVNLTQRVIDVLDADDATTKSL